LVSAVVVLRVERQRLVQVALVGQVDQAAVVVEDQQDLLLAV
jgi:hypothetical protein